MQIASYPEFDLERTDEGVLFRGRDKILVPWQDLNGLINALRYVQSERAKDEAAGADGVVAAVLLQGHVAAAPGDFA